MFEYVRAADYQRYRLNDCLPRYGDPLFHYIPKIVKKLRSQVKIYSFDSKNSVSILGFGTTFKLACNADCIHKSAIMWSMPHFVPGHVASSLNNRVVQSDSTKGILATFNSDGATPHTPRLWSYLKVVDHLKQELRRRWSHCWSWRSNIRLYTAYQYDAAVICWSFLRQSCSHRRRSQRKRV